MGPESTGPVAARRPVRGSVTLVALCLTTVLGIALGSYLALCSRSAQASARLVSQDQTLQLAQGGLEEALWALNQNTWTTSGPSGNATWTTSGANRTVTLSYTLSAPLQSGEVVLTVANYASTGPTWPTLTSRATVTLKSGQTFTKTLQATTTPAPLFGNAIASSESYVSFVAGGTVDSWNSDPDNDSSTAMVPYSFTAGNASNYAAVVAGKTNGTHGVILTQATVRGYVATSGLPVSYSASGSPAASIVGPSTAAGVAIDSTRIGTSAFLPGSSVFAITLPSPGPTYYTGLLSDVLGLVALLLLPSSNSYDTFKTGTIAPVGIPIVAPNLVINRPIRLVVDGNLTTSGFGKITITSTGSLELFVSGDISIGGLGIDNQTNDPKKLVIYAHNPSTTNAIEYTASAAFCGVIYSENKPIDIRQNATFYGALLSRSYVRFSTSATAPVFHYDSALRNVRFTGVTTPYLIKRQTEI